MQIERTLWIAADKMRGAMDPGEYKHVALGLLFLRYISVAFEQTRAKLAADPYADPEDPEEYQAANVFWVPESARWSRISAIAKQANIGVDIDGAMRAVEEDNPTLKDALPKVYGRESLDRSIVTGLIELFTNLKFEGTKADFDLIGRIYEYFIGEFATNEGKRGGEFYTPKSIVEVLVEMTEPTKGRVYDPCCGTGGFFVQSEKFIAAHQGRINDIAVYGQERNHTTFRLARMNLAIRGIPTEIRWNQEGSLLRDAFPDERFDTILANPPFNISDWSARCCARTSAGSSARRPLATPTSPGCPWHRCVRYSHGAVPLACGGVEQAQRRLLRSLPIEEKMGYVDEPLAVPGAESRVKNKHMRKGPISNAVPLNLNPIGHLKSAKRSDPGNRVFRSDFHVPHFRPAHPHAINLRAP